MPSRSTHERRIGFAVGSGQATTARRHRTDGIVESRDPRAGASCGRAPQSPLEPVTMIGQIEIPEHDKAIPGEPDVAQLAGSTQGGPARSVRLGPAARDLSAPDRALAWPCPRSGATSLLTWLKRFSSSSFVKSPGFTRQREGSFRAWLRQVTVNKVRNYRRKRQRRPAAGLDQADGFLERLADPNDALAREWDRDHDSHVVQRG